jgi:hypothetical protein
VNLKIAVKLSVLLTALFATLAGIYLLRQGHMDAFWTSLGMNRGNRLNWCEERVGTLYFYDSKAKLTEKAGKWMWVNGEEVLLDYLEVEKWFAKYCQVPVDANPTMSKERLGQPVFEAQFINGQRLTLHSDGGSTFQIRDQVFRSETMRQALQELLAFAK